MPKYKIGDRLWLARYGSTEVKKPCPICFGKKTVVLILGNDEQASLPCQMCVRGYSDLEGFIIESEYRAETKIIAVERLESQTDANGEITRYISGNYVFDEDHLFENRKDAEVKSLELKEQAEKDQMTRTELVKANIRKSFSWNAGYHIAAAKKSREQAEYHERSAKVCKARAKDDPTGEY